MSFLRKINEALEAITPKGDDITYLNNAIHGNATPPTRENSFTSDSDDESKEDEKKPTRRTK